MSSPIGRDLNDWYATPELQITLCFCALTHNFLKKKYGKVREEAFWRTLKHHIPHLEEYIPEQYRDASLKNRLKQRGDKLNRYDNEHPTHKSKQNSTGRFWEWAKHRYNGTEGEFTLSKEEIEEAIHKYEGGPILKFMEEAQESQEELIDLNELYEQVEELIEKVDELGAKVDHIMRHLKRV